MSQTANNRIRERILDQTLNALISTWGAEKLLMSLSKALHDHDSQQLLRAAAAAEREAKLAEMFSV